MCAPIERVEVIDLAEGPLPAGDDRYAVAVHAAGDTGYFGPIGDLVAALVRAGLGEQALGHPVGDHRGLHRRLTDLLGAHGGGLGAWAIGAIDCAVWDLHGRLAGRPVGELLGGQATSGGARVPAYASWLGKDLAQPGIRADVTRVAGEGYLFTKWGLRRDPAHSPGRAAALMAAAVERASAWAGGPVAVDALGTWQESASMLFAGRVDPAALYWLEDPLEDSDVGSYADLTWQYALPLALGERISTPRHAAQLLTGTTLAAFIVDAAWCGGITAAVDLVHLARAWGVALYPHGRALAPALHLAWAYPDVIPAVEYQLQWEPRRQALFTTGLQPSRGHIRVPDAPGLGRTPLRAAR
jgi:L-alanine-DL-glutamate epimerase-like enolase superfamily enzyme